MDLGDTVFKQSFGIWFNAAGVDHLNGPCFDFHQTETGSRRTKWSTSMTAPYFDKYDRKGASQIIDAVAANGWKRPVEVAQ